MARSNPLMRCFRVAAVCAFLAGWMGASGAAVSGADEAVQSKTVASAATAEQLWQLQHLHRGRMRVPTLAELQQIETQQGYVFVNGEYVPPPYHIEAVRTGLVVNGERVAVDMTAENEPPRRRREREFYGRPHGRIPGVPTAMRNEGQKGGGGPILLPNSVRMLAAGNVLILNDGAAPISWNFTHQGQLLLRALNDPEKRIKFVRDSLSEYVPEKERANWLEWLRTYEAPPVLRSRAIAQINSYDTEVALHDMRGAAYALLDRWNGPLTVSAMILVLASGAHLLMSSPFPIYVLEGLRLYAQSVRPVALSLGFVLVLSAFDLIWTMLTSQAGLMQEVNPLARMFIDQPMQLVAFKSVVTFGSIAIFASLRHFRPAQVGAWWACLICTLLATRWVVFHTLSI